jgi:hypothetical protein
MESMIGTSATLDGIARPGRGAARVALIAAVLLAPAAAAEPTHVEVRVLSKGAKFVGTSMGGVGVEIRDADSGALLAEGVTAGSTGDTERIMRAELRHHDPVSTEGAATFRATLDLDAPRRVEVSAFGPLAQRQAANRVTATMWLVPGKHVTGGDGWLLELPGLAVDVLDPPAHRRVVGAPARLAVRANVTMMCGCPIEPGGLWDADRLEVRALVRRDGGKARELPLAYAGETSLFAAELEGLAPGAWDVLVYAWDPANGNTGLDRTTLVVEP